MTRSDTQINGVNDLNRLGENLNNRATLAILVAKRLTVCSWSASPVVREVRLLIIESLWKNREPEKEAKLSLGEAGKGAHHNDLVRISNILTGMIKD